MFLTVVNGKLEAGFPIAQDGAVTGPVIGLGERVEDGRPMFVPISASNRPDIDHDGGRVLDGSFANCTCGRQGCIGIKLTGKGPAVDSRKESDVVLFNHLDHLLTVGGERIKVLGSGGTSTILVMEPFKPVAFTDSDGIELVLYHDANGVLPECYTMEAYRSKHPRTALMLKPRKIVEEPAVTDAQAVARALET